MASCCLRWSARTFWMLFSSSSLLGSASCKAQRLDTRSITNHPISQYRLQFRKGLWILQVPKCIVCNDRWSKSPQCPEGWSVSLRMKTTDGCRWYNPSAKVCKTSRSCPPPASEIGLPPALGKKLAFRCVWTLLSYCFYMLPTNYSARLGSSFTPRLAWHRIRIFELAIVPQWSPVTLAMALPSSSDTSFRSAWNLDHGTLEAFGFVWN